MIFSGHGVHDQLQDYNKTCRLMLFSSIKVYEYNFWSEPFTETNFLLFLYHFSTSNLLETLVPKFVLLDHAHIVTDLARMEWK